MESENKILISQVAPIARRLFVINSFDGVLTSIGIIVGFMVSGVNDPSIIIGAGFGASVAMTMSGISGTYLTEKAERIRSIKMLEEKMLTNLDESFHSKIVSKISLIAGLVNGFAPLFSSLLTLSPFFIWKYATPLEPSFAYTASLGIGIGVLFVLGSLLGKISKENALLYAIKMALVGAAIMGVVFVLSV